MSNRWFSYVLIEDKEIQNFIDAIIFLCNPVEKNGAHITMMGPLKDKLEISELNKIKNEMIGSKISIIGVGRFFNDRQNTVFLQCGSDFVKKFWKKPDFPFNPHITIYNGKSRDFAEKIYLIFRENRLFFELSVGDVICLQSHSGQKDFHLIFSLDLDGIRGALGGENPISQIKKMQDWERIMILERLMPKLKWLIYNR